MGSGGVLKRAARRVLMAACGTCYCYSAAPPPLPTILGSAKPDEFPADNDNDNDAPPPKNLCAICLEALLSSQKKAQDDAIFTAQCSHAFHLSCISANIRHGSLTCPICRSHWTRFPRNLPCALPQNQTDPIFRILDNSIASLRFHRRSLQRSTLHIDDDPIETSYSATSHDEFSRHALDLVVVASANGRNLKLVKQAMASVVFSLRPIDRLAIVTSCSPTARAFPLRRMTTAGKRSALLVVDGLFHMEHSNPTEGLKKGIKILKDRTHKNLESIILHLVDCPGRTASSSGHSVVGRVPIAIHRFHLGFGFGSGSSNRLVMQEFEELISWLVGGVMRDVEVRIQEEGRRVVRLGELRKEQERRILLGELRKEQERRILLDLGVRENVGFGYSYMEGGGDAGAAATTSGERVVSLGHNNNKTTTARTSSEHAWGFRDPYMAMRWAKHLHSYRF